MFPEEFALFVVQFDSATLLKGEEMFSSFLAK